MPEIKQKQETIDRLVGRHARERAEHQFLLVPWSRFQAVLATHASWREFYFWFRAIVEHAGRIPSAHAAAIEEKFSEPSRSVLQSIQDAGPPAKMESVLDDWIDQKQAGPARSEGWIDALTWFSAHQPDVIQAQSFYLECLRRWRSAETLVYPAFEVWLEDARQFNPAPSLVNEHRDRWAAVFRVSRERLALAVEKYLELEVFAYWTRTALKQSPEKMPLHVLSEISGRLPGLPDPRAQDQTLAITHPMWTQLVEAIRESFFHSASANGWFDAILLYAEHHPLHVRTLQFWRAWDRRFYTGRISRYPALADWKAELDSFSGR